VWSINLYAIVNIKSAARLEEKVLGFAAQCGRLAIVEPPEYVLNGHLLTVTADDRPVLPVGQNAN
jgi:hypothetical protein